MGVCEAMYNYVYPIYITFMYTLSTPSKASEGLYMSIGKGIYKFKDKSMKSKGICS